MQSFVPAAPPNITDEGAQTLGSVQTIAPNATNNFPTFGHVGYFADAGEVADALNSLITRIKAVEATQGITN